MELSLSALWKRKYALHTQFILTTIALLLFVHCGGTFSGPCRNKLPCKEGVLQGDPSDCTVYWECSPTRVEYIQLTCDSGQSFDRKEKQCKEQQDPSLKCTRPCDPIDASGFFPNMADMLTSEATPPTPAVDLVKSVTNDTRTGDSPNLILPEKDEMPNASNTTEKSPVITESPEVTIRQTSVTASTTPEKQTTVELPRPTTANKDMAATTESQTTAAPIVIEPVKSTPKPAATTGPPYVVVTDAPKDEGTTRGNSSLIGPGDQVGAGPGMSGATIGIIAGVVVGVIILVVLVILVVFLLRRRKKKQEGKIVRMENPQYSQPSREQNFRFSRDSTLFVGPTVNLHTNGLTAMNNNSPSSDRRKKLAPPIPESPSSSMGRNKRRAPPPPNPFTGQVEEDLYEKESQGSSVELTTFTARNDQTSLKNISGIDDDEDLVSKPTEPLLVAKGNGKATPEVVDLESSSEDEGVESPGAGASPEQSLINKKQSRSQGNMSVDSYDKEKNPFFED